MGATSRIFVLVSSSRGLFSFVTALLGAGLLVLSNTLLIMVMASKIGAFFSLALVASGSLGSTLIFWSSARRYLLRIRIQAKQGVVPTLSYINIAGISVSLVSVAIPGPLTFLLGWALFLAPLRLALGALLYRLLERDFTAVHEFIQAE